MELYGETIGQKEFEKALQPDELKKMKYGQIANLLGFMILRVLGGWIYYTYKGTVKDLTSAVFVPEKE